jgi:imidazolonepropionase-like amidohydrolase
LRGCVRAACRRERDALMDASQLAVVVDAFFDGERLHRGPQTLRVVEGVLEGVDEGDHGDALAAIGWEVERGGWLMPGLVDAHLHLFLDAGSTDPARRAEHLKRPFAQLLQSARQNARDALGWGVTLVRDAGDRHGINHAVRAEALEAGSGLPQVRSAGRGIKRARRYGAFFAGDADERCDLAALTAELARDSDEIKLVVSGTLDVERGTVADEPQFTEAEARIVVEAAHRRGRPVLAHCIGTTAMASAIAAGADSIEHGFFMDRATLERMRDLDVAWTPTFCPLHFQWAHPRAARWSPAAIDHMRRLLDAHSEQLRLAYELGVRLLVGTDAGCMGVPHGRSVYEEVWHFLDAGVPLEAALRAATAEPRRHFGDAHPRLVPGAPFEAVLFQQSPFDGRALYRPRRMWSAALAQHELAV